MACRLANTKNKDNIRWLKSSRGEREADHEVVGYPLFYARSEDLNPSDAQRGSPITGFELMHSRVCWGLYPIGNWLEARYHSSNW
jgi:hypothetical protein